MRAYLIDPETCTIGPVDLPDQGDRLPRIYKLLGCDTITAVHLDHNNALYVDDEGLLKPLRHFIAFAGYPEPLAGKALVVGTTPDGADAAPTLTLEKLRASVAFVELLSKDLVILRKPTSPGRAQFTTLKSILQQLQTVPDQQ